MKYSECNPHDTQNIISAIEERLGDPDLFVGRQEEFNYLLNWVEWIPRKMSKSTALLSRRKKGKTAIVERLYNIIYTAQGPVIPFFYQIREEQQFLGDFAVDFYRSFLNQYFIFKLRDMSLKDLDLSFTLLLDLAKKNNYPSIQLNIEIFLGLQSAQKLDAASLWNHAFKAPHTIASQTGDFILQIIDEFQLIDEMIFYDQKRTIQASTLAGCYLRHAESKVAPLLVTGSWVGWLMNILDKQLPSRFKRKHIGNLTTKDGITAALNYAERLEIPVTEESAVLIAGLCNNDPYYISSVVRSDFPGKDLLHTKGVYDTFCYEVVNPEGDINMTWMEYMQSTFFRVNGADYQIAKRIVFYLSNHPEKQMNRKMIRRTLNVSLDDMELDKKLQALQKGDLLTYGRSRFFYRGIPDDVFNFVLRSSFEDELEEVETEVEEIMERLDEDTEAKLRRTIASLQGKLNYHKGIAMDYYIGSYLRTRAYKKPEEIKNKVWGPLPPNLVFTKYIRVSDMVFNIPGGRQYQLDVYAKAIKGPDLVFEVKHWSADNKPGTGEAEAFVEKLEALKSRGETVQGIFYSTEGITKPAEKYLLENGVLLSDHRHWWNEEYQPPDPTVFDS